MVNDTRGAPFEGAVGDFMHYNFFLEMCVYDMIYFPPCNILVLVH